MAPRIKKKTTRKKRKTQKKYFTISPLKGVFILLIIFFIGLFSTFLSHEMSQSTDMVDMLVGEKLASYGIYPSHCTSSRMSSPFILFFKSKVYSKEYSFARNATLEQITRSLRKITHTTDIKISKITYSKDSKQVEILFSKYNMLLYKLRLISKKKKIAKKKTVVKKLNYVSKKQVIKNTKNYIPVAIVLDDWGYNFRHKQFLESFNRPLTIAILPNLPYSNKVAKTAHEEKMELLLHMPMEPLSKQPKYEETTLFSDMNDQLIIENLNKSIEAVPYISGINNHQGSKLTTNETIMTVVMKQLKKKKLFFFDSMTNNHSIAFAIAKQYNVPSQKCQLFLDNKNEKEYVKQQLYKLFELAKTNGYAIAIGHDRPITIAVLREEIPKLEKKGLKLVKLSYLLES